MTIDLTRASVRPAGADGIAARTAAGFIVLAGPDATALVDFIDEHQTAPNLIELLAARVVDERPSSLAMLFTSGGEPYLFAWGAATTSVTSSTSRFTVTPVAGELLVHPLSVEAESTVVLSNGPIDAEPPTAPINLAEGSMQAKAAVIDLSGRPLTGATPTGLPSPDVVDTPPAAPPPEVPPIAVTPEPPMPVPAPSNDIELGPTELLPSEALAFGQPAAEEIVFADDLEEISDLIEPEVVPETQRIQQPASVSAEASSVEPPPAMPAQGSAAELPPEFAGDAEPAVDPLVTVPLPGRDLVLEPPVTSGAAVMVLGATCPNGHHNHPDSAVCTTCGAPMPRDQTVILVNGPRPPLGLLVVDDGNAVSIDHDLVIGRDPMAHEDVRSGHARPMTLTDETLALSRQHARIVLDDWSVFITDLESSNGTWINRGSNAQEWSRVEAGVLVELNTSDRLRIGGRLVQVELHHS